MDFINPYKEFYILAIPEPIARYRGISSGAKLVYGRLCRYAGKKGVAFPHIPELADEVGLGERQTKKHVQELVDDKLIHRERVFAHGNVYRFLNHPCLHPISPMSAQQSIGPMSAPAIGRHPAPQEGLCPNTVLRESLEESHTAPASLREENQTNTEHVGFTGKIAGDDFDPYEKPKPFKWSWKKKKLPPDPNSPSEKLRRLRESGGGREQTGLDLSGVILGAVTHAEKNPTQPTAPQAPIRDFPSEWNRFVPSAPVDWRPDLDRASAKRLKILVLDQDFCARFQEAAYLCQAMRSTGEAEFVSFPWFLKAKEGTDNWRRVLGELRWMAKKKQPGRKSWSDDEEERQKKKEDEEFAWANKPYKLKPLPPL